MTREPTLLDDIYEGEVDDITFPCAGSLKDGEAIAQAVVTCTWLRGAPDADAATRATPALQISGADLIQRLDGCLAGAWYLLDAVVTLNSGRKLVGVGLVYCKKRRATA